MATEFRLFSLQRLCFWGLSSGVIGFVVYQWHSMSMFVSRLTKLASDAQSEHVCAHCSMLVTPSMQNCHSFRVHDASSLPSIIDREFEDLLSKCVDWTLLESPERQLSFGMVPERQLSLIMRFWSGKRNDACTIDFHCYSFCLHRHSFKAQKNGSGDALSADIRIAALELQDLKRISQLNAYPQIYTKYLAQVIESDRVSLGAYHRDQGLVATAMIHVDDLSFGGLAVDKPFRRSGIAEALARRTIDKHFKQGYSYVTSNTSVDNTAPQRLLKKLGFEKANGAYYWLSKCAE